jgi:hypothetical protein
MSDDVTDFVQRGQAPQIAADFERASAELRKLGITLRRLPGEYSVNFINAGESTARILHTLDLALAVGRIMAAERGEASSTKGRGPRRRSYRPRTPKAWNRQLRKRHMRKLRARALRQQRAVTPADDK